MPAITENRNANCPSLSSPRSSATYRKPVVIMGYYPDTFYKVAALVIESGCEWITLDRDFDRFEELRWQRPAQVERS